MPQSLGKMTIRSSRALARVFVPLLGLAAWAGCNALAGIQEGTLSDGGPTEGGSDSMTVDGPVAGDASPHDSSPGDGSPGDGASSDGPTSAEGGSDGGDGASPDLVVQVSAGGDATCAITQSGALYCWGANTHGSVGDGTTTQRSTAVHITKDVKGALLPPITQVSAGALHVCARSKAGAIYCWGNDSAGQLGDGVDLLSDAAVYATDEHAPQLVSGLTAPAVACGFFHTCALGANGFVTCWGSNGFGELGHTPGTYGDVSTANSSFFYSWANSSPIQGNGVGGATQNSLGLDFTCSNDPADERSFCMGSNGEGQLGDLEAGANYSPVPSPISVRADPNGGLLTAGTEIAASSALAHACALDAKGDLYCWGSAGAGALGPSVPVVQGSRVYPTSVMQSVSHVVVGGWTTCVVDATEHVQCWGGNVNGQLGHDPATDPIKSCPDNNGPCNPNPSTLMSGGSSFGPVATLTLGLKSGCALKRDSTVWCWGDNSAGELGNNQQGSNDAGQNYEPVKVLGLP
jgi:alpha-tubulin suppressor-like RCC1 family protein